MQQQKIEFECPNCGGPLDIQKLQDEGHVHILSLEYENGSPSYMKAGVLCPGCGRLVNPKTIF